MDYRGDLLFERTALANRAHAELTRRRLERVLVIDAEAAALKRQIAALVDAAGSTLTDIHGVGPLVAARFLAEVVDARRYLTGNAFAAANGTAPIPASSGRTVRYRYNPGGNRQLNRALYTIALTQISADTEGRTYYRRKRGEGKTGREALRCLKRRISDRVYRTMLHDAASGTKAPGQGTGEQAGERTGEADTTRLAVGAADAHEARLTA